MSDYNDFIDIPTLKQTYGLPSAWVHRLGTPKQRRKVHGFPRSHVENYLEHHREEYQQLLLQRAARSRAENIRCNQEIGQLISWVETVAIEIRLHELPDTLEALEQAAERSFWQIYATNGDEKIFKMSLNALISHVRHCHTNYDAILKELQTHPGVHFLGYLILKTRVNQAVLSVFHERYESLGR
jgi:hypothetical protein